MSKLESIPKELRTIWGVPRIANAKEFQEFWNIQRYLIRLNARRVLTPEIQKYCDKDVKKKVLEDNEYLGIILHTSLKTIVSYLHNRDKRFRICVYLSKDPYLPNWEGITILVNVVYRNFRERMRIWREIEDKITKIINNFKKSEPRDFEKISEANETIATTVEKF